MGNNFSEITPTINFEPFYAHPNKLDREYF